MSILCAICGNSVKNNTRHEIILTPIEGTQDGLSWEAQPIHLKCIEEATREETRFMFNREIGLLYLRTNFESPLKMEKGNAATNKN